MSPGPFSSLPSPEHLQLLNTSHLKEACAEACDDTADASSESSRRALVGTALVRNARFEQRRRTCSVPVRDRYAEDPRS